MSLLETTYITDDRGRGREREGKRIEKSSAPGKKLGQNYKTLQALNHILAT